MLELKGIYKTFNAGTVNEKRAIDNLNLTLENGDFVTIIGGNGAGKSTTLNLIAGVFPVDAGTINLNGFNLTHLPEHKRAKYLGRVFQDPMMGTAATMGIEENLALAYRRGQRRGLHAGITNEERKLYREKLATLGLGLEDRMTSKVGLLSGGQRQALTLLMATLRKPDLLLLDEHTAALDPKTADKVLQITEEIVARDNLTTMMVTHNMKDAIVHGNRLIMMYDGNIVIDVSGEENAKRMAEAAEHVKTGTVTYAVRDSEYNGVQIHKGDIIGMHNGKIEYCGNSVHDVVLDMMKAVVTDDAELITVYYGADTTKEDAEQVAAEIAEQYPNCDVDCLLGGQPLYYYLISVE